jgi:hypothetical protein
MGMGLGLWRWAKFFHFSSAFFSHIFHISVASQYCPIYRRVLEKKVKRSERRTANIIGAIKK